MIDSILVMSQSQYQNHSGTFSTPVYSSQIPVHSKADLI